MYFQQDFEFEASNGLNYFIEVEGEKFFEGTEAFTELDTVTIHDEQGNRIDASDSIFEELNSEAFDRDYEVEIHHTDNNYYGTHEEGY